MSLAIAKAILESAEATAAAIFLARDGKSREEIRDLYRLRWKLSSSQLILKTHMPEMWM